MGKTKKAAAPAEAPEATGEAPEATGAATSEETAVVVHEQKASGVRTVADVQALMLQDAEDGSGHGFEKGDVAIPFLRMLQSNSPQVKRQNGKYVEGAEAGFFFNTATNRIYDGIKGILAVPVHFMRQATLWVPRGEGATAGGGFAGEIPIARYEELLKLCTKGGKNLKKDITPLNFTVRGEPKGGLELVLAAVYYLFVVDPATGAYEPVAYPLTSTQLKKARAWNAMIQNVRLPNPDGVGTYNPKMFGMSYRMTAVPEQNNEGDWMGVKIVENLPLLKYVDGKVVEGFHGAAQVYLAARDFYALVGQGKVKTQQVNPEDDGGSMGSEAGAVEEEVPLPF